MIYIKELKYDYFSWIKNIQVFQDGKFVFKIYFGTTAAVDANAVRHISSLACT